jgi:hypothetical protein
MCAAEKRNATHEYGFGLQAQTLETERLIEVEMEGRFCRISRYTYTNSRTDGLLAYSIVPQPTTLSRAPTSGSR